MEIEKELEKAEAIALLQEITEALESDAAKTINVADLTIELPDEMNFSLEYEVDDGETELELEFSWSTKKRGRQMMKHGPVDVAVFAFGEARFDGSALAELERQAATGIIRVLDLIILLKDENEECWRIEGSDLPPEQAAAVAFIEAETIGLFDNDDAVTLCEGMVPGSAVVALAIEHTWALDLANAIHAEGGEMALNSRVPAPIVDEAFALLS